MNILTLSRLQFAITIGFHFLFVPLTLGLSIMVAYMETLYYRTGEEIYLKMTKFWGKLLLINFALGVVTGITMEFQFGMNWAEYSKMVGDIFGAPLAIEATLAFFLESTFMGVWLFGWDKVSKKVHLFSIWMVAFGTNLSAIWILLSNGFMQRPVGFVLRNNRAEMVDFGALVTNIYGWLKFFHTCTSAYVLSAFFVIGISAYHLLKKSNVDFFKRSFKLASSFGLFGAITVILFGAISARLVAQYQPPKLASMEAIWETQTAVPYSLFVIPDPKHERNIVNTLKVPYLLSLLSYHHPRSEIKGLKSFPKENRPPMLITFLSYRTMLGLSFLFLLAAISCHWVSKGGRIQSVPWLLKTMLYMIPLPYLAIELGWIVAEVGRQPWVVYGILRTSEGVSRSVSMGQIVTSLSGFTLLYGMLSVVDYYLMTKFAKKGPGDDTFSPVAQTGNEGY
ncbi:MAG: cytochrome ubiquinol oxidase subunit I [Candidatus Omnitrophota bacterium]